MQSAVGQSLKTEGTLRLYRMMRIARADEPFLPEIFGDQIKRRHLKKRGDGRPDDDEVRCGFTIVKTLSQASERALIFSAASLLQQNTTGGDASLGEFGRQLLVQFNISCSKLRIIASLCVLPPPQQSWRENAKKDFICELEPVGDQTCAINGGALKNQRLPLCAHTLKKPTNPRETFSMFQSRFAGMQRQRCAG